MIARLRSNTEISTEAALFSLQRFVERLPDPQLVENVFQFSLLQTFDLINAPSIQQYQMPITEDTPVRSIMRSVRENTLFNKDSVAYRTGQIARFAKREIPKEISPDPTVVRRIASEVVRMPHFISEAGDLSQTITHIHCLILAKLDLVEGHTEETEDLSDRDVEVCSTCSGGIAFESLCWSRCVRGHLFSMFSTAKFGVDADFSFSTLCFIFPHYSSTRGCQILWCVQHAVSE